MKKFCLILVLFQILINNSWAQEVTGDWHGLLDIFNIKLRITIHVDSTETGYSATLDSPEQDAFGIPLDTLIISDNSFSFKSRYGNYYKGVISRKLQIINGVLKNAASSTSLTLNFSRQTIEPAEGAIRDEIGENIYTVTSTVYKDGQEKGKVTTISKDEDIEIILVTLFNSGPI